MNIEIRKSFTKDADKLPAPFKKHLSLIIGNIEKASQPSQLDNCKNLPGLKRHIAYEWVNIVSGFITKIKQLNW